MDVFTAHEQLITDYAAFTTGFTEIRDQRIRAYVDERLRQGDQWPDPFVALNPAFASGGSITDLVRTGVLHRECERIFRAGKDRKNGGGTILDLHQHQREAIELARSGGSYLLTTGTGSGKSLGYLVPIVDTVLRARDDGSYRPGVKAIVVYPMNALANSQKGELEKFLLHGYPDGPPVTFRRYTGQDGEAERRDILESPPDILLTNYVMLELLLVRPEERRRLITASSGLRFLVLDELHTYRGRQGADVALLVRRVRDACGAPVVQCVGTSATLSTEGSEADRRATIAGIATRMFGVPVGSSEVVGETLRRSTAPVVDPNALAARITGAVPAPGSSAEFAADPLASWVEARFGLAERDGRLVRADPGTIPAAAAALATETGLDAPRCARAVEDTLRAGAALPDPRTGRPIFAFRLHQFLSKGDNVHLSPEAPENRHITSRYQTTVPGRGDTALLPAAFCRECGQEYLAVRRDEVDGAVRYTARRDHDGGDPATAGYLFMSTDLPWPDSVEVAVSEGRLPETWLVAEEGRRTAVVARRRRLLPVPVRIDPDGREVAAPGGAAAAFVPGSFAFCLRCRVSYEQLRSSDFGKLASLSAEGRSSATSVVTASVVRSLRQQPAVPDGARKLLAFADNRQDASLQAGHFNDFVQVVQLRGALHRALLDAPDGLTHEVIEERVVEALGLGFADVAANPDARFGAQRKVWQALRQVVGYRLFLDLERGWRVTMPNLEQTGLLRIDYADLAEIAAADDLWHARHVALRSDVPGHRAELMRVLLGELRRVLALDADSFSEIGFERLGKLSAAHLREPWALAEREQRPRTGAAFPRPGGKSTVRGQLYLSGYGAFGRYLRRAGQFPLAPGPLSRDDAQDVIVDLLEVLREGDLLTPVRADDEGAPGYRLKVSSIIWRAGDGTTGVDDPVRRSVAAEQGPRINPFFRDLYAEVASTLAGLRAREHTAQVTTRDRVQREEEFRSGALPVLYCSPTMELGIDIADLNAVVLRNVPPTPANYAQRAGRAGRSGQPALVVTYCSTGNAHDQYYFRHRTRMVSGTVSPPRLDLGNADLLRAHVHAVWLAETGLALSRSVAALLDLNADGYPLDAGTRATVEQDGPCDRAAQRAATVLAELAAELDQAQPPWWHDGWVHDVVGAAAVTFDRALDRWRELYRTAKAEQDDQNRVVLDHSVSHKVREIAVARRREAETQIRLLLNADDDDVASDFYSYRYLATEGFLPGYSFPRLPLRAYVPGRPGVARDGDFLHRPRFIAISEFGPGSLVYHEGVRYQVHQVQLPPGEPHARLQVQAARRCPSCGYLNVEADDSCRSCDALLGRTTHRLLRLQTVRAVRRDRISSDEEERRRSGYSLVTSYRFADGDGLRGTADSPDGSALEMRYGDGTTVRVTNLGLRRRRTGTDDGYWIDARTGRWLRESADADAGAEESDLDGADGVPSRQRVVPFVEDVRNVLVTRLPGKVDDATAASVMFALERGVEAEFQLEDGELTAELLPDDDGRGRALFVESAEGGAGVLRRLIEEPGALARAARRALDICHFDPDTGADLGGVVDRTGERCARACYDCLLSYGNQGFHQRIDRHTARTALLTLARTTGVSRIDGADPHAWEAVLLATEADPPRAAFAGRLATLGHRPPDRVAVDVPEAGARPHFVYDLPSGPVAVFVNDPEDRGVNGQDADAEDALRDIGWAVVRVRSDADVGPVVARFRSVFGPGR